MNAGRRSGETRIEEVVVLTPARDPRLPAYVFVCVGAMAGAVLTGQPTLAALGTPFLLALALGLRKAGPVRVSTRATLDKDRVVEGDGLTVRFEVRWEGRFDARLLVDRLRGVQVEAGSSPSAEARGAESVELSLDLEAARWGRHGLGDVWLRLRQPFGLLSWTGKVGTGPAVQVLPEPERLDRLLHPRRSRAVWGQHPSPRIGDGHEFAELRPYTPGDRLRDLNWAATARHRSPVVNRHHPELASEVVVALDAFVDGSEGSEEALSRAARAAWALTTVHLEANDKVGLAGLGGSTHWLPPGGGRLARYRLLNTLLDVGGDAAGQVTEARYLPPVPASALILLLTPLHTGTARSAASRWKGWGRSVVVVVIDGVELMAEPSTESERLARRLWRLERRRREDELRALGVPVIELPPTGPITPAVAALARTRALRGRRGVRR